MLQAECEVLLRCSGQVYNPRLVVGFAAAIFHGAVVGLVIEQKAAISHGRILALVRRRRRVLTAFIAVER
jgi:hypothetical protein